VSNQLLARGRLFDRITDMHQWSMGMEYSVSIDVPHLDEGLRFYRDALGLTEIARPIATYVILKCGEAQIGILEKPAGTKPAKGADDIRRYERHWTPVHIDFHVDDLEAVLARVLNAGAICEQKFEMPGRPPIAFCSDPFGGAAVLLMGRASERSRWRIVRAAQDCQ
jgi:predicted enzyme related to lactoylglutathione lyase